MREYDRRIALGSWGERKAMVLLDRAGFSKVRDVNVETFNHPFGDIYAERAGMRYLIGVKTRNKFRDIGLVNGEYNIQKKGVDVKAIARPCNPHGSQFKSSQSCGCFGVILVRSR